MFQMIIHHHAERDNDCVRNIALERGERTQNCGAPQHIDATYLTASLYSFPTQSAGQMDPYRTNRALPGPPEGDNDLIMMDADTSSTTMSKACFLTCW